jgi:EmrB/QacA subfamily drug resistance transporter
MATAAHATTPRPDVGPNYKWMALSNTTLGGFMAFLNQTIVLISLPVIFRGLGVDPIGSGQTSLLLWILMSYNVASTISLATIGRISDTFGKVRFYNLGFVIFTIGSLMCALTPGTGNTGAYELIAFRFVQGIGGAFLMANGAAILTDAFPRNERGLALGLNQVIALAGSVVGLVGGGLLAVLNWRLLFLINVPVGIFGTVWAFRQLKDLGERDPQPLDIIGNVTFGAGLLALLIGTTYALLPYGGQSMGWTNPIVEVSLVASVLLLSVFVYVESKVKHPMVRLSLFRIRDFWAGNLAGFLAAVGRGGLQFILVIWLQGVWLPLHGVKFADTPLQAGLDTLPMMAGFVVAGPAGGALSDRIGVRGIATSGMLVSAAGFLLLTTLPTDFAFPLFAFYLFITGVGMGMFAAPNTASIMNSVPARYRSIASGMRATFINAGMVISMSAFFTVVITGLSASLPDSLRSGLSGAGAPLAILDAASKLPPASALFAALLGYNPFASLLSPTVAAQLTPATIARLQSPQFFSSLIGGPFTNSLHVVFYLAAGMAVVAAAASVLRSGRTSKSGVRSPAAAGISRGSDTAS